VALEFIAMRGSWTPSIVPRDDDQDVYLVVDDLRSGRVWREAEFEATDLETVIQDLLAGQYQNPFRVVSLNSSEGRSRDVSADIAEELRWRCDLQLTEVPAFLQAFVEGHEQPDRNRQLTFPLV
jgi:hypothetical protein